MRELGILGNFESVKDFSATDHRKAEIVWRNVIGMILLHIAAAKGLFFILAWRVKLLTIGFGMCVSDH